jgi:hypothetical protein
MKCTITCVEFRPLSRNTLRGFAVIRIEELRLTIRDVAIHEKNSARWAQLPAKPMLKDGAAVFKDGKAQYATIMEFDTSEVRAAFSKRVIEAVEKFAPQAFENINENAA